MKQTQGEKSERSRNGILEAALNLFSHQGYRGTSIREIAEAAGLSTGNVYPHFPDTEALFRTLLDQYWAAIDQPDFPFNQALAAALQARGWDVRAVRPPTVPPGQSRLRITTGAHLADAPVEALILALAECLPKPGNNT